MTTTSFKQTLPITDQMKTMSYRQLVRMFKAAAEISEDGNSVTLAGYTAKRDPRDPLQNFWKVTTPPYIHEKSAVPGRPEVPVGPGLRVGSGRYGPGGYSFRFSAIACMAQCAARDVIEMTSPKP